MFASDLGCPLGYPWPHGSPDTQPDYGSRVVLSGSLALWYASGHRSRTTHVALAVASHDPLGCDAQVMNIEDGSSSCIVMLKATLK